MANTKTIAENRKAFHDYFILEEFEAGIELKGTEVKSIRAGKVNLKDSYADIVNGECILRAMHISPYEQGNIFNVNPLRDRKLLLHKNEIVKLDIASSQDGATLVPLRLYFKEGKVKVALAIGKGKKNYDKRDSLLEKTHMREIEREFRNRQKY
ncbi:SsrA-binding protein SmpB [Proteiniclasticum sp. QWL-01]|uniref:SsrA-binding protein SmpB n=1 Tax=Proteiniclasticum sp. QWL-01 TaxID=3036945 RepID=UPI00220F119E|nr:SsrA-binding protein SmpB [Proteiniclasticum sp. QWL-01]UUM12484.1 SsrA-binding protein SmpB [Clostridiaceae bacterium HFYG-1003]WFF74051.1 SsrA-binding protein SmpB [Proteiniclasticum sp. QWL-01]